MRAGGGKDTPQFGRDLSWIQFNRRVLAEAHRDDVPLLERFFLLTVVAANFDEFFMVRVAAAQRGSRGSGSDRHRELLQEIHAQVRDAVQQQYHVLGTELLPGLARKGLCIVRRDHYSLEDLRFTQGEFEREVFPVLTPVRFPAADSSAVVANLGLNVAFLLAAPEESQDLVAIVPLPAGVDRLRSLPAGKGETRFTLLEDVIVSGAARLFPGYAVLESLDFRLTRDADLEVDEARDEDFMAAIEEVLINRRSSDPVRLEVGPGGGRLCPLLQSAFRCETDQLYSIDGPLDLRGLSAVPAVPGFDALRHPRWSPVPSPSLPPDADLWEILRQGDVLLHRPFDSFEPVVRMVTEAADDAAVMAIRMTLYRTETASPIVAVTLERAARNGKQVTVLVELKARFEEAKNIDWAHRLQRAGAIVIFGVVGLKVHAKALLVVRREQTGIRRYVHLSTGNYNTSTARQYTDLCLLSSREQLGHETTLFFNAITGYSSTPKMARLSMAPTGLKQRLLTMIRREAMRDSGGERLIMAKLNSLNDPDIVAALYAASQAGVPVRLNVRGICTLVPGVAGVSENIEVISIVGRFLEHSRVFYFANGGAREVYLSSADWMPRNLEKRVELMFPVQQEDLRDRVVQILQQGFADTAQASRLHPDGSYRPVQSSPGGFDSQRWFCAEARRVADAAAGEPVKELRIRRLPPGETR